MGKADWPNQKPFCGGGGEDWKKPPTPPWLQGDGSGISPPRMRLQFGQIPPSLLLPLQDSRVLGEAFPSPPPLSSLGAGKESRNNPLFLWTGSRNSLALMWKALGKTPWFGYTGGQWLCLGLEQCFVSIPPSSLPRFEFAWEHHIEERI